jgi:hypothetical protein
MRPLMVALRNIGESKAGDSLRCYYNGLIACYFKTTSAVISLQMVFADTQKSVDS